MIYIFGNSFTDYNFRPQTGKVANVILAGTGDDSDDAEEFLVEEKPKDQLDLIAEASANTTQADVSKSDLTRERSYVRFRSEYLSNFRRWHWKPRAEKNTVD